MKSLIVYFSRAGENFKNGGYEFLTVGNTKIVADKIKNIKGYDIFELEMANPYSDKYNRCVREAKADLQSNARPELVALPENMEEYDTIILCYPSFCNTMPMPVWTFLEAFDFTGKTIKPLCTHEGSGMGASVEDITKLCPGAVIEKGLAIRGSDVEEADDIIKEWV